MQISELLAIKPLVIIGLGNTGSEYTLTRHNTGFLFVQQLINILAAEDKIALTETKKNLYTAGKYPILKINYLTPLTMMNNSGLAVSHFLKYHNLTTKNLLVVHDDLDIPLGSFKLQLGKSPKGHNGIISLEQHLNTKNFYRLRIGVENRSRKDISGLEYVLKKFLSQELKVLQSVFTVIIAELLKPMTL